MSDNNKPVLKQDTLEDKVQEPECDTHKCCPLRSPSRDFVLGGAFVAMLGTTYWFVRCRNRVC